MERTRGSATLTIGLIDGPVNLEHPDLRDAGIRTVSGGGNCSRVDSVACAHGTFVAGILTGRRGSSGPAIAPGCTLLVHPIFPEGRGRNGDMPSTTPEELAGAIFDTVRAGARVLNLSAGIAHPTLKGDHWLNKALNYAAQNRVVIVAAAGNDGTVGGSVITRHPWVIPVVSCDLTGRPAGNSNLGRSIGQRGISAPGDRISSVGSNQGTETFSGTSVAAPFVTGAIALLGSEFPYASPSAITQAISGGRTRHRRGIVPPLLDAWAAYLNLQSTTSLGYVS
jgi:subtilisin family serine protease